MFEQFNCCPGWYIIAYLPLHIHFDSGPRWYIIAYLSLHIHFDGGPGWYIIAYLSLHIHFNGGHGSTGGKLLFCIKELNVKRANPS